VFNFPGYKTDANQNYIKVHLSPARMAISTIAGEDAVKTGTLLHCW
jgi:hypothetical protein